MTINDLRRLNWVSANWTECPGDLDYSKPSIKFEDIQLFLNYTFKEVARKANLPYNDKLIKFLKEENSEFYAYLSRFTKPIITNIPRDDYKSLKHLLKIPEIDKYYRAPCNNAQKIINEFESLSDIEKLKVLEHLKLKKIIIE